MASPAEETDPSNGRRIRFKNYGGWRANLLLWGVPLAVVVIFLVGSFSSQSSTSVSGIPFEITCDGWSGEPGDCGAWAQDVVDSEGIPEDPSAGPVTELKLKKSFYGFVDQCTANICLRGRRHGWKGKSRVGDDPDLTWLTG